MNPGAQVIPPPGWEPLPHRYNPGAGSCGSNEKLVQAVFPVVNVASGDPVLRLDVHGRQHLSGDDGVVQIIDEAGELFDDHVAELTTSGITPSSVEFVRNTVDKDGNA